MLPPPHTRRHLRLLLLLLPQRRPPRQVDRVCVHHRRDVGPRGGARTRWGRRAPSTGHRCVCCCCAAAASLPIGCVQGGTRRLGCRPRAHCLLACSPSPVTVTLPTHTRTHAPRSPLGTQHSLLTHRPHTLTPLLPPHTHTPPAGLQLLGRIDDRFVEVVDVFEPVGDGADDAAFISKGYDATSHFESEINDVLDMYRRITGEGPRALFPPAVPDVEIGGRKVEKRCS